jgi:subtilisin family serine protease
MNRSLRRVLAVGGLSVVTAGLLAAPAQAAPSAAPVQDFLADQLSTLTGATTVLVHGTDIAAARAAVAATGMRVITEFERIGVVVASGSAGQIEAAGAEPGVTYLEGNTPIAFTQETSNTATRGAEAVSTLTGANGQALDGSGVSVAVIDSGVDPTHPYFRNPDGGSAVVANLKSVCLVESDTGTDCVLRVPGSLDTDTVSGGGQRRR